MGLKWKNRQLFIDVKQLLGLFQVQQKLYPSRRIVESGKFVILTGIPEAEMIGVVRMPARVNLWPLAVIITDDTDNGKY